MLPNALGRGEENSLGEKEENPEPVPGGKKAAALRSPLPFSSQATEEGPYALYRKKERKKTSINARSRGGSWDLLEKLGMSARPS